MLSRRFTGPQRPWQAVPSALPPAAPYCVRVWATMAAQRACPLVVFGTYLMLSPTYTSAVLKTLDSSLAKPWLNAYPNFRLWVPRKFLKYARSWLKLYFFHWSKAVEAFAPMLL